MTTPLPIFQVDAFAERPFTGNPAAVMPLTDWLPDDVMQAIGAENNLAETAFTVPSDRNDADYDLRWFTPAVEVNLCGHDWAEFEARGSPTQTRCRLSAWSGRAA